MNEQEAYYSIALTRLTGLNTQTALHLCRELGSAQAVYDHRDHIRDAVPDCSERLVAALSNWDVALARAAQEMAFAANHHVSVLCLGDSRYPARLSECPDAPIVLYALGSDVLNAPRVVSIVGTRRCTTYGQDLVRRFVASLCEQCPDVLIVSGLAYGIDISAHREALHCGLPTVGVLAHGLDDLYPAPHRDTARQMLKQGGLLTEYMSETRLDKMNFVRRNRIVAGMADATILVESAAKGGGIITARIAQDYNRSVMAFPGAVGALASEGCNLLIRDNVASLITSADDFVAAMGWQHDARRRQVLGEGIERSLFPDLSPQEKAVVQALAAVGDLQAGQLAVQTNISVGSLTALLFQLEMKGVVRALAGGNYHLLT